MRLMAIALAMLMVAALDARRAAEAQPYCARYETGSRECGIPTLQACQQSLSGLGGVCERDITAQLPRDFLPPLLPPPPLPAPDNLPPNQTNPNNPNWMPPPPGQ